MSYALSVDWILHIAPGVHAPALQSFGHQAASLSENPLYWYVNKLCGYSQSLSHIGLSYVMNAAIRPQNGSNLYDELLNSNQQ